MCVFYYLFHSLIDSFILDDGRHSRSSVVSNSSRQAPGRRTSQRQPSASNLSPPSTKRPRRDAQRNVIYKHSPDFEEEDDDGETEDNDSQGDAMEVDRSLIKEETRPVNTCLYCKQPARDPNSPQYCSDVSLSLCFMPGFLDQLK